MKLADAFELYEKDQWYIGHIDTLIDMSYILYWDHEINKQILIDSITKTSGIEIAEYIVGLIIADKTSFK